MCFCSLWKYVEIQFEILHKLAPSLGNVRSPAIASFRLSAASGFGLFGIHKLLRPSDIVHLGRRIGTEMNWIEDAVTIVHYCRTFFIFGNLAQINPMPVRPQSMQARWSTRLLQDSKGMARVKECKPPSFAKQDSSMSHTCYHHLLSLNIFIIYTYIIYIYIFQQSNWTPRIIFSCREIVFFGGLLRHHAPVAAGPW